MNDFYEKLAEILEVDEVLDDDIITDFEQWDSLSALSVIAMFDSDYGITISAEELVNHKTVGALNSFLINNKK